MDGKRKLQFIPKGANLPISLVSDTTIYFFEKNKSFDTLALSYERKFFFETPKCGFVVEILNMRVIQNMSSLKRIYVEAPYREEDGILNFCK
jgi:hypothetical protein